MAPRVVAIIRRNSEGKFERIYSEVTVAEGDPATLLPVKEGVVFVVGTLDDDDEPLLSDLLSDLI
jgi:hypothetical protein